MQAPHVRKIHTVHIPRDDHDLDHADGRYQVPIAAQKI